MGLTLNYIDGQTPIDEDEKTGLLIPTIATRNELDEFEQLNIEEAMQWMLGASFKTEIVFTEKFICTLHKQMFGNVWQWAGQFRKSNKNIGVDKWQIPMELKALFDDCRFWIENYTYEPDEIAIRFKHRLVKIHCFANGNGRHSRMMADLIVHKIFNRPLFRWGMGDLIHQGSIRDKYLAAIREADNLNYIPLIAFSRS